MKSVRSTPVLLYGGTAAEAAHLYKDYCTTF